MTELASRIDRQWAVALRYGPYVLLALGSVMAGATYRYFGGSGRLWLALALAGVSAVLHRACVDLRWTGRPFEDRLGVAYVIVRWALAFVMTWLNPFYAVFAVAGYFDSHLFVPLRRVWMVLLSTAVIMAGSQSGGLPPEAGAQWLAFGGLFVLNAGLALLFGRIAGQEANLAQERTTTITRLEEALAENAALQSQLVAQAREAGVHEERERLALEIHDTIAQSLTGIVTQLQAAEESIDDGVAREHRERAASLAREALGEARRSVQGLMPMRLDRTALADALDRLVRDWAFGSGVASEVTVTGVTRALHRDVETTVLRVAQESLANVAKHACATRVGVTLSYTDDELVLDVRDDGIGFDPATVGVPAATGGVGLGGMRQRAARLASEVVVESEPGGGTAVSLRVPSVRHG